MAASRPTADLGKGRREMGCGKYKEDFLWQEDSAKQLMKKLLQNRN